MLTRADELKKEIEATTQEIEREEARIATREKTIASLRAYVDNKRARRMKLEAELAREEAPLRKPTGHEVIINDGGFLWRV